MSANLDAIMASGEPAPDAAPAQPINEADATPPATTEETQEGATDNTDAAKDAPKGWPKSAENTVLRKERKIGKLTAEKHQALRDVDFWKAKAEALEKAAPAGKPDREKFNGDDEAYVDAVAETKAKNTLRDDKIAEAKENIRLNEERQERARQQIADESGEAAREAFPDWDDVINKHATQVLPDGRKVIPLSPDARKALLESDHTGSAIYSILKDGQLDELNSLPFHRAFALVERHEKKALESISGSTSNVTKAPAPMAQTRGSPAPGKSAERMTAKELLAEARA